MVPNRIRLSAVGRSRRLIVEARGFRGSAPVLVFYFTRPKSILTAGARFVPETPCGANGHPGLTRQSSSPRRHALAACSRSSAVFTNWWELRVSLLA